MFAIAGGGSLEAEAKRLGLANLPNVVYLGYVSDGEAKALMHHCKAFLFPTLYEGFGIPPLEAVACGAPRIYVSDTPCMREIYGDCAGYIDLKTNRCYVDDVTPPRQDAAQLLARGATPGEVAAQMGYCSGAYFSQKFRAATGNTPSAYRRMQQGLTARRPNRQQKDKEAPKTSIPESDQKK